VPLEAWDDEAVPAHLRFHLPLSEGPHVL